MKRLLAPLLLGVLASSCSADPSPTTHPSVDHTIRGCYISCRDGYFMRRSHSCKTGVRWMLDIGINGEDDVQGDPSESRWFAYTPEKAAYNKQDVELGTCQAYIARICGGADSKCGMHPGEPDPAHSNRPISDY